ncbi:MAG: tetratricopeptide repeat protein [bacterium]
MMKAIRKIVTWRLGKIIALSLLTIYHLHAAFEDIGTGARPVSMANAFTAVADDVHSIYYNPSGLAAVKNLQVASAYGKLFVSLSDGSDLGDTNLAVAYPLKKGTLGAAIKSFSLNGWYDENQISLAYGRPLGKFSAGLALRSLSLRYHPETGYAENALDDNGKAWGAEPDPLFAKGKSKDAFSLDIGIIKRYERYSFAFVAQNVNKPNMGINESYKIPMRYKLGSVYKCDRHFLTLDIVKEDNHNDFRFGVEFMPHPALCLRSGLEFGDKLSNFSAGFGYRMNIFSFDYAFTFPLSGIEETLGTHWMGIVVKFGEVPEIVERKKKVKKIVLDVMDKEYSEKLRRLRDEALTALKKFYLYGIAAEKRGEYQKAHNYFQRLLVSYVPLEVSEDKDIVEIRRKANVKIHEIQKKESSNIEEKDVRSDKLKRQYFGRATAFYVQGEYGKAIKEWEKVLEIDPNHELSKQKIEKAKKYIK